MAQLMLAMQTHGNAIENLLQSAVKKSPPTFKKPRVGGIDSTGVWTGRGSKSDANVPRSDWCYRASFSTCPVRSSEFLSKKREHIKGGLPKTGSALLFSSADEPNSDQFVAVLRALEEFIIDTGNDGLYNITRQDPT